MLSVAWRRVVCGASLSTLILLSSLAQAQRAAAPATAAMPALTPAAATAPAAIASPEKRASGGACQNADALGVARVVEIDTTGGPGFGSEHFKAYNFLRMNEVVLTFDDGPWPGNTSSVLAALAAECTKATFFPIGKHATWHPEILQQVSEQGHTIGSHTWSHADLGKKPINEAKDEIEKGLSAVRVALGSAPAPFFRFPNLRHPPELVAYLGERNIGIFSTDFDSFDFKMRKPEGVIASVMAKLRKFGKGMVLLHDFQHPTAEALPELLQQIKAGGYKVVHMKARDAVQTLSSYDALMAKEIKGAGGNGRPLSNVVRTISE